MKGLLAAVTLPDRRAAMHGLRADLLSEQAAAVQMPLRLVEFDARASPASYEHAVRQSVAELHDGGAEAVAFGDIGSIRRRTRRIELLRGTGVEPVFPLWGRNSQEHAYEMLESGLSARVCSAVVPSELPSECLGTRFGPRFLSALSAHVDPCGENDEFHTFVEWSPGWRHPVRVEAGRLIERWGLTFTDFRSAATSDPVALHQGTDRGFQDRDLSFDYFDRLRRVRRHVDSNLGTDLGLESVAAAAAMTPSSFQRYFRRNTGMTFRAWLGRYRVRRACELLVERDLAIAEVSKAVGFSSERTFRRLFRQHTGLSPSQYRRDFLRRLGVALFSEPTGQE